MGVGELRFARTRTIENLKDSLCDESFVAQIRKDREAQCGAAASGTGGGA